MNVPPAGATLTVSLALAAGMSAQLAARHLRLPSIVVLLLAGALLGPDGLGMVRPDALGSALRALVGFAVALVLFEGALNLDLRRLRHEGRTIRRLVTIGALVTMVATALLTRWVLDWDWRRAVLFGALMIVTGPTVIQPLLRRLHLLPKLETILAAEAIFGDAIGATAAVVALELVLSPEALALGPWLFLARVGVGVLVGGVTAALMALALRAERLVPEGLENGLVLSFVFAAYAVSESLRPESGIVAVVVAGVALGNLALPRLRELRQFKEQLSPLLLGMLFVLLAADVRLAEVRALGMPGLVLVALLALVVRPLDVLASTAGSGLRWQEKAFLSWLAPRGIVAAAVASLFSESLETAGIAGGRELRAMVFLVIALTVLVEGTLGNRVAALLGVRRAGRSGYLVLGANALGRVLAATLRPAGEDVVLLDTNPDACRLARAAGLAATHGSADDLDLLEQLGLGDRGGVVAVTPNEDLNLHFARRARSEFGVPEVWVAQRSSHQAVSDEMIRAAGAHALFGEPQRLELWADLVERGAAKVLPWRVLEAGRLAIPLGERDAPGGLAMALAVERDGTRRPWDERTELVAGDVVWLLARGADEARLRAALAPALVPLDALPAVGPF